MYNLKLLLVLSCVYSTNAFRLNRSMLKARQSTSKSQLPLLNNAELIAMNPVVQVATTYKAPFFGALSVLVGLAAYWLKKVMWTPTRTYDQSANTVGREYDAWTTEGILEYYWGEHIHLGYYTKEEMEKGYLKKNFIEAKYDFIDRMLEFGDIDISQTANKALNVLDVGCGIGGTSRYLANKLNKSCKVTGITLSSKQVERATQLAQDRGIENVSFQVMDALNMTFPDNSFDLVWACESGEHMPDKKKYIEEMTRVLKPGGRIIVATWCQRDDRNKPFDAEERKMLDFLYAEWTHPYFISIDKYAELMKETTVLNKITTADWVKETIASWRHSIWVGVFDPWPVVMRPHLWYKCFRDGLTLERMHKAFDKGLMQYGMMTAIKTEPPAAPAAAAASFTAASASAASKPVITVIQEDGSTNSAPSTA